MVGRRARLTPGVLPQEDGSRNGRLLPCVRGSVTSLPSTDIQMRQAAEAAELASAPGSGSSALYRTQSWLMRVPKTGCRWKLPTRLEVKTTSLGLRRGIAMARSTSCRSSCAH